MTALRLRPAAVGVTGVEVGAELGRDHDSVALGAVVGEVVADDLL